MAKRRCTISKPVIVNGIGLHSGVETSVCFRPAPSEHGIVFSRVDLPTCPTVTARVGAVADSDRRTALREGDTTVETVEHVLAAVYANGIDDLIIEVNGPEPPVGDGSARDFFNAIVGAGVKEGDSAKTVFRVKESHTFVEGDARYDIAPNDRLRVSVTVEWDHPNIGLQSGCYEISRGSFAESLAEARTFGFEKEVHELHRRGLARGASEETVIVLTETGILGPALRWPDEFVRHKAVDLVGDLALLGARIEADIVAFRPNHKGNLALARFIERVAKTERLL